MVDDDPELRKLLSDYLTDVGFEVDLAGDGEQMRRVIARGMPDAIVMDLMLPGTDGLALTRELRATSTVPILMLSARGEEIDRVVGLEVGADDYLAKPFSPRELLARLRALLRRAQAPSGTAVRGNRLRALPPRPHGAALAQERRRSRPVERGVRPAQGSCGTARPRR